MIENCYRKCLNSFVLYVFVFTCVCRRVGGKLFQRTLPEKSRLLLYKSILGRGSRSLDEREALLALKRFTKYEGASADRIFFTNTPLLNFNLFF